MGKLKNPFDLNDLFVFAGLGVLGYGLWLMYPPMAYVVTGAALFLLGVRS